MQIQMYNNSNEKYEYVYPAPYDTCGFNYISKKYKWKCISLRCLQINRNIRITTIFTAQVYLVTVKLLYYTD